MKNKLYFLLVAFSLLSLLAACTTPSAVTTAYPSGLTQPQETPSNDATLPQSSGEIKISDALGREVILEQAPQRIVVSGKALIMVLDAIYTFPEASSRIAAIGEAAQGSTNFIALIDPQYQEKAILQHDAGAEQIAAVHPDLVILKSVLAETTGKALEIIGIPVVYVDFETPEQYYRDLQVFGDVFQNDARAQLLVNYYQQQVNQVQTALEGVTEKPRTLLLYYNDHGGGVSFNVPPITWMQTKIVDLAGGEPVWASASPGDGWAKVSFEQIAAWDADVILIVSYAQNPSDIVASLKTDPQWQALRAVQQDHLLAFPGDLYSWDQPDIRWVLGLTWLASRLHPDRFPDLDIIQETQEFYQVLYDLDQSFFNANIRPLLKGDIR